MKLTIQLICISILAFSAFPGCGGNKKGSEAQPQKAEAQEELVKLSAKSVRDVGITRMVAVTTSCIDTLNAPATLIPSQDQEAQVGSFVSGRVVKVFVRLGDHVRRGQILMQIEGTEIGEVKSRFIKAKAQLRYAEATLERQKALLDQKIGSKKNLLEAQAEYEKAEAELNAEDKKIHSIGLSDEDVEGTKADPESNHVSGILPIKAPLEGSIVERNVVIGQLVDLTTNAFKIVNTSVLWADAQVPEQDAARLDGKQNVRLLFESFPGERFDGKILHIGQTVDEHSRMVKVRAAVQNPRGLLKPQMFAQMHIPTGKPKDCVVVPSEALVTENKESFVFVSRDDSTFIKRPVRIGTAGSTTVQILSGVRPGESIVTKGAFFLKSELKKATFGAE